MTTIVFITGDEERHIVEATDGLSVMECARRANVPGIIAECGGACTCATCHVHIASEWMPVVGESSDMEHDMLDFATDVRAESRLSCQITVGPALNGLIVKVPNAA
ncbi:2Fe-2S iron-sulfur cluster binding domain-containing protein [Pusillimonas sp. MFBS29]|uniref:2Fe-2S iron-sulfur cluster-binding protein n=1 Tax=Pusillimonas sp. MFBS29 TaxID=2886690 RepID=UPI001D10CACA|nr:2Fe-2S iron-sulfur cluster-binding protein [Pusillimonas sp. MFBS29]MCC2596986.1 2Fe-2S iron-sulfur cluster binding domain-containing protein [Pusillimonas sp. MFBS29]